MDNNNHTFSSWLRSPAHHQWLVLEGNRLLAFAKASRLENGFGSLDDYGRLMVGATAETMNTARMTHCFAMAHAQGIPGCAALVDHGVAALSGPLRDAEHDGWFSAALEDGGKTDKQAYLHAFVALAASSAVVGGRPGAQALLSDAIQVIQTHFWSEQEGAMRESFAQDWSHEEAYRGANSNMHSTEAFLALADVTGDAQWLDRALSIVERVIHQQAGANNFQVIEHFTQGWQPLPDYNHDNPADGFRPFGTTPGHAFEWARLVLHLETARRHAGVPAPTGCSTMPVSCSPMPAATAGTWTAHQVSSTPSTGRTNRWFAIVCTGFTAKPLRLPLRCCNVPASNNMKTGIAVSGSSTKPCSSIRNTAAGVMN